MTGRHQRSNASNRDVCMHFVIFTHWGRSSNTHACIPISKNVGDRDTYAGKLDASGKFARAYFAIFVRVIGNSAACRVTWTMQRITPWIFTSFYVLIKTKVMLKRIRRLRWKIGNAVQPVAFKSPQYLHSAECIVAVNSDARKFPARVY